MEKKRNKALTLTLVLLLLVMVTLGTLGGTFAKYTSSATGTDSARVAKWSFTVEDEDIVTTDEFVIDLFNTTYDYVKSAGTDNVVAPGTSGEFELNLTNGSEVDADYVIDYEVTNAAGIPIQFSVDGNNWSDTLAQATGTLTSNGEATAVTIQWKWVTDTDAADTELGAKGTDTITVKATVTATQKVA